MTIWWLLASCAGNAPCNDTGQPLGSWGLIVAIVIGLATVVALAALTRVLRSRRRSRDSAES